MVNTAPPSKGSSFRLPMLLLPAQKRADLLTLYAYCRAVDDAVDDAASPEQALDNIAFWESASRAIFDDALPAQHPVIEDMRKAHQRRGFKPEHIEGLLASMRIDAEGRMVGPSLALLKDYCYGAASCVGLLSMRIFGCEGEDADAFAFNLGMGMQMTNILRDIEVDALNGRVYLPASMNFYALHAYATVFYDAAFEHSRTLPSRRIAPALAMRDVYYTYHRRLEKNGYQPPKDGRISLAFGEKLRIGLRAISYLISR